MLNIVKFILNQKEKMDRLKVYGFVTEPISGLYLKTKLFKKYYKDGKKFNLDDDEDMIDFLVDNYELFLEVIGVEFKIKLFDVRK